MPEMTYRYVLYIVSTDMKIVRQNSGEIREVMQKDADGKWHKYAYAKGTRNARVKQYIEDSESMPNQLCDLINVLPKTLEYLLNNNFGNK